MTAKSAGESPGAFRRSALRQSVLDYIAAHPDRPLKARALAREIGVADENYADYRDAVREMIAEGRLTLGPGRALLLPATRGEIVGVFRRHRLGFGFVQTAGRDDLYVARVHAADALDGDTVAIKLIAPRRGDDRPRAEIARIVERAAQRWVGVLERVGRTWGVRPQGRGHTPLVTIEDPTARSAQPGDLVVVEPLGRIRDADVVPGVIIEKLGPPSRALVQVRGAAWRHGIPDAFPQPVREAAAEAVATFDPNALDGREDLRGLLTFTIDPADARDFDDAISIEPIEDGRTVLGVHIADVAHFVPRGSALDAEARARGNSAYFPGYVSPMLPEVLSNGVCSLQPGQPRLTLSAFIRYDPRGRVVDTRFCHGLIRSRARLTYEQASASLDDRSSSEIEPAVLDALRRAARLARAIQRRRIAEGMVSLALPEAHIRLGADGEVIDSGPADTSFSHTLIEMFMVEANEAVCRALEAAGLPHLRRVHAEPEALSAETFATIPALADANVPQTLDRAALQRLLKVVRGRPEEFAVNYRLLRALPQAEYLPNEGGHYALASSAYAHFTSPIRRYPDLVNHRALAALLRPHADGRTRDARIESDESLAALAEHTSATERRAQQAERETRHILILSLMKQHVGKSFDALITGVSAAGVFVQVRRYLADGFIPAEEFDLREWLFDEGLGALVAAQRGRIVALGQAIRVTIVGIDEQRFEMHVRPAAGASVGEPIPPAWLHARRAAVARRGSGGKQRRGGAGEKPRGVERGSRVRVSRDGGGAGGRRKPGERGKKGRRRG